MQKWEYLRVMADSQSHGGPNILGDYHAVSVNGRTLGSQEKTRLGEKINYPNLDEYARQKGEEGWEMVGVSSLGDSFYLVIMFKRPKS